MPFMRDGVTLPVVSVTMAQAMPGASLVELEPAKHAGHFEHHACFAAAVQEFVTATVDAIGSQST